MVAAGVTGLLFTAAACGTSTSGATAAASSPHPHKSVAGQHQSSKTARPKPDLSGIPQVVARVNDHIITRREFVQTYRAEFNQVAVQSQSSGAPIDQNQLKKRTANTMVGTELLVQEAHRRGVTASMKAVNQTLQQAAQQNGMKTTSQLMAALKKQGMTAQQVRSQASQQLLLTKVISAEGGNTTPTRQELKKLYHQLVAQQKQSAGGKKTKTPSFSQVEPQLEQRVKTQKQNEAAQRLVQRLRKQAHITINL
ncbi:MAG: SurA N-terminal domain-containing protein [Nocardioidaceae bacterium]